MALKNIPQAERLLSGTLTSYLSDVATTCVMSDPPSKFPTYIDLEPDSTTKKELVRAVAVSGSTVTIERSINGVTSDHAANATYKQKLTSRHWDAVSDALDSGYLMEDALRVLTRVSDTQFTITGYGASDDLTTKYAVGRYLRSNSSNSYVTQVTSSSYAAGTNKTTVNVADTLPTPLSTIEMAIGAEGGFAHLKVKATASEVATGTDDAKIVTPLSAAAYGNSSMARQAIINGNFDVWQRGTSVAWGDSVYTADRWMFNYGAVIAGTVTRQDGTGVYGSRYCTRVQRTAGASTVAINFTHSIESNDSIKFRGKKVTLSFYARKGANYSAASDYLVAKINTGTGTDEKADRYTGTATVGTTNAVLTTSWQKYTVTTTNVLADTVTELGIVFNTIFTGTAGAADYFEITQVQLCAGDVALPFQPKSFNQELIDCERYCQSFIGITNGVLGYGNAASATAGYISIPLKRAMFGTVGVTLTASDWKAGRLGDALVDVTSLGMLANYQGNNNLILELGVASGLPAGESIVLVADGTTRTLLVTSEL